MCCQVAFIGCIFFIVIPAKGIPSVSKTQVAGFVSLELRQRRKAAAIMPLRLLPGEQKHRETRRRIQQTVANTKKSNVSISVRDDIAQLLIHICKLSSLAVLALQAFPDNADAVGFAARGFDSFFRPIRRSFFTRVLGDLDFLPTCG